MPGNGEVGWSSHASAGGPEPIPIVARFCVPFVCHLSRTGPICVALRQRAPCCK
jgi:hypothetical protein